MAKKGIAVWFFSSLTVVSLVHLVEAISVLGFNGSMNLMKLYPVIGQKLQTISPEMYLVASAIAALAFWAITCMIAFENPVEQFLNKILSDAKRQSAVENQLVQDKTEVLDAMFETIENGNETIAHVRDMMYNVRTEVTGLKPLAESIEKMKNDLNCLKGEVKRLGEKTKLSKVCFACGEALMPNFKVCPYCGEHVGPMQTPMLDLKDYK